MIGVGCQIRIMPEQTKVAMMHAHFLDESFTKEVGFVFIQMHIVLIAQRGIHDDEWMHDELR